MTTLLSISEFEALADAHGGDLPDWPDAARARAEATIAQDSRAAAYLAQTRALEAMLRTDAEVTASPALMARILADAADVAPGRAVSSDARDEIDLWERIRTALGLREIGVFRPAGALTACLAVGFIAGASLESLDPVAPPTSTESVEVAVFVDGFGYVGEDDGALEGLL